LLQSGKPSNKIFGIEVKSTGIFKDYYNESIEKDIVRFWLTQPFPVFVVVYEESSDNCYWISVEDHREEWTKELPNDKKSITIRINRSQALAKNQNSAFIKKMEQDIIIVNANRGIPQFISKGYEGYTIGYVPILKLSDAARENVRGTIRFGFNYLINDSALRGDLQSAYSLGKQLGEFDHGHYDHFLLLARICRQLGKKRGSENKLRNCTSDMQVRPQLGQKKAT
jgi:penicillin-binding protein-related factor A (putative recombinase)